MTSLNSLSTYALLSLIAAPQTDAGVCASACRVIYWRCAFDFGHGFPAIAQTFLRHGGMELVLAMALGDFTKNVDAQVVLPAHALSYDALVPLGQAQPTTLRRLAIEYRRRLGQIPTALNRLIHLTRHLARGVVDNPRKIAISVTTHSNVFLLERLINFMANMGLDGNAAQMSPDRRQFTITSHSTRQSITKTKYSFQTATDALQCFLLVELTPTVMQVLDRISCRSVIQSCVRFYCNHIGFANQRVLYRLSHCDPCCVLERAIKRLNAMNARDDQLEQFLGFANIGLRVSRHLFHSLCLMHRPLFWRFT